MLDFISYNRFNTFIDRVLTVRKTVTSTSYVDNSADDLFTGPVGTILQKRGNVFSYKYPNDSDFTVINYANNSIADLIRTLHGLKRIIVPAKNGKIVELRAKIVSSVK